MEHDLSTQLFRVTEGIGRIEANQAVFRETVADLTVAHTEMHNTIRASANRHANAEQQMVALTSVVAALDTRVGRIERRPMRVARWVIGAGGAIGLFLATAVGEPVIKTIAEFKLKAWGGHP